ncbi:BrnA antitoxin family protein [Meridianimarinicoccus aquatilis]|uniref:Uncharacterized protein n=1 Tax=Meridianimarinicoccus aquatilis TaxID=2552766 RepID=A0A4R6AUG8_9RHOB|nr:BrnA antitoxin family protein [Fluviibacterium aquatile]TDL86378.1 hypothetical protein E2L05_13570 [Fluviibacterium aquatile]
MPSRPQANRPSPAHRQPVRHGRSRAARHAYERLILSAYAEEAEKHNSAYDLRDVIPEAWDALEQDVDLPEPRVKTTLYLDKSVSVYFRALGPGWQNAVNRVLATYAQMKIADVRLGERLIEEYRASERDRLLREAQGLEVPREAGTVEDVPPDARPTLIRR